MNSNTSIHQNNYLKNRLNIKDDSDMANISQSDLLMFLQFYFKDANQNLKKILSGNVITNDAEIYKITSSFNFWLNFSLNFKDTSFVNLLLCKNEERAEFCKRKLKDIIQMIVKFLYDNLKSEEAFNKMLKNHYHKLHELILKLKDIIDNVYNSSLRDEIFINTNNEEQNNIDNNINEGIIINEENINDQELPIKNVQTINQTIEKNNNEIKQFNNKDIDIQNLNNIIKKNNINIINNKDNNVELQNNEINETNQNQMIEENLEEKNGENNNNISINNNIIIEENNNTNLLISPELQSENNNPSSLNYVNENNSINYTFPLKINSDNLDYREISKLFYNFCYFANFNIHYFQVVFFEKVGYAFLHYNGDFMWADEYTTYVLFEEDNIKKLNLFNMMTDFSKYILKKKYKDHFFDFKDEYNRLRVFTYTIDGSKNNEQENKKKGEKLFDDLCKIKTLVSRASPVLLNGKGETYIACIFLETKFSLYRQNFDYFYWKSDWNNK